MKRLVRYLLIVPPLAICAAAVILCHGGTDDLRETIPAATESQQLQWLAMQGLQAERIASQAVTIPAEFTGSYAAYAALQEQQALPLADYAGRNAVCVTYQVTDSEPLMYTELLTADGILIGAQCYLPEEGRMLTMQGKQFTLPAET